MWRRRRRKRRWWRRRRCVVNDDGRLPVGAKRPDECAYPANKRPAQKEVEKEDPDGAGFPAKHSNDRREKIREEQEEHNTPSKPPEPAVMIMMIPHVKSNCSVKSDVTINLIKIWAFRESPSPVPIRPSAQNAARPRSPSPECPASGKPSPRQPIAAAQPTLVVQ